MASRDGLRTCHLDVLGRNRGVHGDVSGRRLGGLVLESDKALGRLEGLGDPLRALLRGGLRGRVLLERLVPPRQLCGGLLPRIHGLLGSCLGLDEVTHRHALLVAFAVGERRKAQGLSLGILSAGRRGLQLCGDAGNPRLQDLLDAAQGELVELLAVGWPLDERARRGRDERRLGLELGEQLRHGLDGSIAALLVLPAAAEQHQELALELESDLVLLILELMVLLRDLIPRGLRVCTLTLRLGQGRLALPQLLLPLLHVGVRGLLGFAGHLDRGLALLDGGLGGLAVGLELLAVRLARAL
mmetsp:Transcript_93540/g.209409  ORF Transcript_93540/g.209409 Transcript_93540/m.209409 type:complete len:300 (-) Transcript_93540:244-1143(-)